MAEAHLGELKPFTTIGEEEKANVLRALEQPLSGYIGGVPDGGYWAQRLEYEWRKTFGVQYAIPCNSATSGLLAACMAVGIGPGDTVWTTPYSMSATAACAKVLGAKLRFVDIEPDCFGVDPLLLGSPLAKEDYYRNDTNPPDNMISTPKAVIVTNLFGHPARLLELKKWCDAHKVYLIEDNAQAPFATVGGAYTGTIGDIGVFSLNVHKHIQCGEGGVIVTNRSDLAFRLQGCINHGELSKNWPWLGLNLRMTEPIAAIACAQLAKAEGIIEGRRQIGLELSDMVKDIPWIKPHTDRAGCKHVYYLWTALVENQKRRGELVIRLNERGVPIRGRYAPLLHKLFNTGDRCPTVEAVDDRIIVFEVCAYDLRGYHLDTIREIIKRVTGEMHEDRAA